MARNIFDHIALLHVRGVDQAQLRKLAREIRIQRSIAERKRGHRIRIRCLPEFVGQRDLQLAFHFI